MIGVGSVSGTGDSVVNGIGVSVSVGRPVDVGDDSCVSVGLGVADAVGVGVSVERPVAVSGVEVEGAGTAVSVTGSGVLVGFTI